MHAFTDVLQKMFLKIPQNSKKIACTKLSWLLHRVFPENLSKVLGTPFLWNTSERLLLISIQSSYRFCFRTDQCLFSIPTFLGYTKIHGPRSLVTSFTWSKYCWGKNYFSIKKVHDIYFIKHINYFHKALCRDSEYDSSSEFDRVLNIPGLWICQLTQHSKYAWIILIMPSWMFLDMSEHTGICVNFPKSAWMAFISPL